MCGEASRETGVHRCARGNRRTPRVKGVDGIGGGMTGFAGVHVIGCRVEASPIYLRGALSGDVANAASSASLHGFGRFAVSARTRAIDSAATGEAVWPHSRRM